MNHSSQRQRILRKLAKLLEELQSEMGDEDLEATEGDESIESETTPGCSIKVLPKQLQIQAARTAVKQNPVNAPRVTELGSLGIDASVMNPLSIAVITTKYWGPYQRRLTVSFLESTPTQLRKKILEHMNAWNKTAGISFTYVRQGGNVRITREDSGYWSYVGTDVLHINANRPTMCLQDFSTSTPTSEYRRVVRHETGHTLGFPHEHMRKELVARLDRQKCYDYFGRTQGWTRQEVDAQVLTPLSRNRFSELSLTKLRSCATSYQAPLPRMVSRSWEVRTSIKRTTSGLARSIPNRSRRVLRQTTAQIGRTTPMCPKSKLVVLLKSI